MRAAVVAVTYALALVVGIFLGLWMAGLTHVDCPAVPGLGRCLLAHRLSASEAALIGLAGSVAVLAVGITADVALGRRRRGWSDGWRVGGLPDIVLPPAGRTRR
jgi:hypothetical protein